MAILKFWHVHRYEQSKVMWLKRLENCLTFTRHNSQPAQERIIGETKSNHPCSNLSRLLYPSFLRMIILWLTLFMKLVNANSTLKIVVLIFSENNFDDDIQSVNHAYEEVFGRNLTQLKHHTIVAEYIDGGYLKDSKNVNRLQLTNDMVCERVLNNSIAVIIYAPSLSPYIQHDYHSWVSSITYALGFYSIPTMGIMIRESEFSKKKIYPTFVRPTPPYAEESYVFLNLLRRLDYKQVVVVSVNGDRNGEEFVELFEIKRKHYKIHVRNYISVEINDVLNGSLAARFEEITSNIIVMYAAELHAYLIFGSLHKMMTSKKVWIINEEASKASNLPDGAIAARLSQTPMSALRSSLGSIKESIGILNNLDVTIDSPKGCGKNAKLSTWVSAHGPQLLRLTLCIIMLTTSLYIFNRIQTNPLFWFLKRAICSTSINTIVFNERCENTKVNYDILNYNKGLIKVGWLHGSELHLTESEIHWSGGGHKPLEISLPKHLRVVTIHDPPFIYTHPVISLMECESLDVVEFHLGATNAVQVEGPWYPCPMGDLSNTTYFCCAGYAIDMLFNLSQPEPNSTIDTSFTFSIHLNESYGAVILGGQEYLLTGALGELDSDMADLAIGGMTINTERESSSTCLYTNTTQIPRDSPMQSFLQPLKSALWASLLVSVIVVGLVIYFLDLKSPCQQFYHLSGRLSFKANGALVQPYSKITTVFQFSQAFSYRIVRCQGNGNKVPFGVKKVVFTDIYCFLYNSSDVCCCPISTKLKVFRRIVASS
ncbi:hypothetical protein DICVIV_05982 [Dictyocaulus viviparus]|uniref:Receptor ligand binding region domain-containing protein n=1 Tax=Dictyocaulus viviparus TaxID=29172 RepID=A0A0D8XTR8_DICVI|nr:hypothetical protein DICVIV_05982 [Dictyocaulus viviparus]